MKIYEVNGKKYRLPNKLNDFQLKMYVHLINWKWTHLKIRDPGIFKGIPYDSLLPNEQRMQYYPLYIPIKEMFLNHQKKFNFKLHKFLGHSMASSQTACANLFLPLLKNPDIATKILSGIKTDIKKIATDLEVFDNGFRLEFWDELDNLLNDHTNVSGTDSDIAIAYYDHQDNLNLWLIEHKLTESEFTTCGAFKSPNRSTLHTCKSASAIIDNKNLCYYHSACNFNYWNITLSNASPFNIDLIKGFDICPFMGGMNQLWRNQLLTTSIESSNSRELPYKKVYFSVVYHPENSYLNSTISEFKKLIGYSDRFFTFTSDELINKAKKTNEPVLSEWLDWYQKLYYF
ncbi:MAG: hypothetical protein FJW69_09500 [Actinobacteria bacterium]|nr:hypothetical protein [Actinomycetota bacterium]